VQRLDRGFRTVTHFHEREPPAPARLAVRDYLGLGHLAVLPEQLFEVGIGRLEREVPDIQILRHVNPFPVSLRGRCRERKKRELGRTRGDPEDGRTIAGPGRRLRVLLSVLARKRRETGPAGRTGIGQRDALGAVAEASKPVAWLLSRSAGCNPGLVRKGSFGIFLIGRAHPRQLPGV
jgi:hypothetical protein